MTGTSATNAVADPLADVLATLRMQGTFYFRTDFRAPWGVMVPALPGTARFHIALAGETWVRVGDALVNMMPGDLVLVPHGVAHALVDSPAQATIPLDEVLRRHPVSPVAALRFGGNGAASELVCGHFHFEDELLHPVVESLPKVVHLSRADGHDFLWLDAATRALAIETENRAPGWSAIVDRVAAILFIQALRATAAENVSPVLEAFRDPGLAAALAAIHANPADGWTLEALARKAGMSRTSFTQRFRERLGSTPMAYVTRWRLQRARQLLVDSEQPVAAIAAFAGYGSEAAFSKAFARSYGQPPATYRRRVIRSRLAATDG